MHLLSGAAAQVLRELGLREQAICMHTHLVFLLSFNVFITLVHPLHGNPYSLHWHQLMGISIARWLAASMWDFLLFCLLHITPIMMFYSTYSAMSMACAHVLREGWKIWSALKSMNQLLGLSSGLCMMWIFLWWRWSIARLYDFVGTSFLWLCYFNKT